MAETVGAGVIGADRPWAGEVANDELGGGLGVCFFFQAEDGIRDLYVTGVQTCALPISRRWRPAPGDRSVRRQPEALSRGVRSPRDPALYRRPGPGIHADRSVGRTEIGRASCRERWQRRSVRGSSVPTGRGRVRWRTTNWAVAWACVFFFKQKTAYEIST